MSNNMTLSLTINGLPELSAIAEGQSKYREDCIVRNYVIARMFDDGIPESDIAAALGKHRTTIHYALHKHRQDLAASEAYRALIAALDALQCREVIHN